MRFLASTLDRTIECGCGLSHHVATRQIFVGAGALARLPRLLADLGLSGRGLIIGDENTLAAAGTRLGTLLATAGRSSERLCLTPGAGSSRIRCDLRTLRKTQTCLKGNFQWAIAVGSGSIGDLVRISATRVGIPYIAVVTAPSNAGILSPEAEMLDRDNIPQQVAGLTPAAGVIADIELFRAAPPELIRAGVGDAISCAVSPLEWQLNRLLCAESYCERAGRLVRTEFKNFLEAAAVPQDSPEFLGALTRILLTSGCATQLVGRNNPATGGEHAFGRAAETIAHQRGREPLPHGLNVAAGSWVLAESYRRLFRPRGRHTTGTYNPGRLEQLASGWKTFHLDAGQTLQEKADRLRNAEAGLEQLFAPAFRRAVSHLEEQYQTLRKLYRRFELPHRPEDLGLSPEDSAFLLEHASALTGRLSLLDLIPGMIRPA